MFGNPPYIDSTARLPRDVADYEPAGALFAGVDGLDDYRRLIPQLPALFAPEGRAFLEIGSAQAGRSEEHTSELQSLMRISYAVFCLKKKKYRQHNMDIVDSERPIHNQR